MADHEDKEYGAEWAASERNASEFLRRISERQYLEKRGAYKRSWKGLEKIRAKDAVFCSSMIFGEKYWFSIQLTCSLGSVANLFTRAHTDLYVYIKKVNVCQCVGSVAASLLLFLPHLSPRSFRRSQLSLFLLYTLPFFFLRFFFFLPFSFPPSLLFSFPPVLRYSDSARVIPHAEKEKERRVRVWLPTSKKCRR